MNIVVDDALLFALLTDTIDRAFGNDSHATDEDEIFTTSSWYWRLSRAVAHGGGGSLSRPFQELPATERERVASRLADLPTGIGFVDTRRIGVLRGPQRT